MDRDTYSFVKALVAALRLEGSESIFTMSDLHQQRFQSVFVALKWDQHPVWTGFIPLPITGKYAAFDSGLFALAREDLVRIDRFGRSVQLILSREFAQSILNRYDQADQDRLKGYAQTFLDNSELVDWHRLSRERVS